MDIQFDKCDLSIKLFMFEQRIPECVLVTELRQDWDSRARLV